MNHNPTSNDEFTPDRCVSGAWHILCLALAAFSFGSSSVRFILFVPWMLVFDIPLIFASGPPATVTVALAQLLIVLCDGVCPFITVVCHLTGISVKNAYPRLLLVGISLCAIITFPRVTLCAILNHRAYGPSIDVVILPALIAYLVISFLIARAILSDRQACADSE